MKLKEISKLVFSIIICQLAGAIGSIFTSQSIAGWYTSLNKPFFNPPNWVFGPVWITLYLLMGVSLYLVWIRGINKPKVKIALAIFGIHLFLNASWSIIFFGLRSPFYAFLEIILLWLAILLTMTKFYKISKTAAYLLIPYIIWVTFAAILNYSIWVLNI